MNSDSSARSLVDPAVSVPSREARKCGAFYRVGRGNSAKQEGRDYRAELPRFFVSDCWVEASPQQPSHRSQHSGPAEKIYDGGDFRVVLQSREARKDGVPVMLNIIGIAGRNQG